MMTSVRKLTAVGTGTQAGGYGGDSRQEERALLDRCAAGDEKAIRWVLNHYRERMVRLATHIMHDSREAEDIAQEAFIKALRSAGQFRGKSGLYTWLYHIVLNLCRDRLRRKYITAETAMDSTHTAMVASASDVDQRLVVEQVLNSLSLPMRVVLILRAVEGLEYSEIAAILNVPVGTVRSRLNTAREQFRRRWAAIQEETARA